MAISSDGLTGFSERHESKSGRLRKASSTESSDINICAVSFFFAGFLCCVAEKNLLFSGVALAPSSSVASSHSRAFFGGLVEEAGS
jgi:hypothetical protein